MTDGLPQNKMQKGCITMSKYKFKAINLLAETFEKHEANFHVLSLRGREELLAGFPVNGDPLS